MTPRADLDLSRSWANPPGNKNIVSGSSWWVMRKWFHSPDLSSFPQPIGSPRASGVPVLTTGVCIGLLVAAHSPAPRDLSKWDLPLGAAARLPLPLSSIGLSFLVPAVSTSLSESQQRQGCLAQQVFAEQMDKFAPLRKTGILVSQGGNWGLHQFWPKSH